MASTSASVAGLSVPPPASRRRSAFFGSRSLTAYGCAGPWVRSGTASTPPGQSSVSQHGRAASTVSNSSSAPAGRQRSLRLRPPTPAPTAGSGSLQT